MTTFDVRKNAIATRCSTSGNAPCARPITFSTIEMLSHSGRALPRSWWSIDRLARESNLSRATLTRHFTALVGEPPLAYLTRWRMELAARQLRETNDAVGAIAHRVGYTSEFAFSRAFSRLRGRPPGRYRVEVSRRNPLTNEPSRS